MASEALPAGSFLFASESVTQGHAAKLCDRVADAVLDACLGQDPDARVACEACTKTGMVMVLGEIMAKGDISYEQTIREAVKATGYDSEDKGLDWRTMNVIVAVDEQSPDLAQALSANKNFGEPGEYGMASGYATDETPERMPMSHVLASRLCAQLDLVRKDGSVPWLLPSAWAQVIVEYKEGADGSVAPARVHSVSINAKHLLDTKVEQIEADLMEKVVKPVIPSNLCDDKTAYHLCPLKQVCGVGSEAGGSGRQLGADFYGGWGANAGASASGRDGLKVSRSGAYGARWAARSLVDGKLCKRCTVQLAYVPGSEKAVVTVQTYGTGKAVGKSDAELAALLSQKFDFRLASLQRDLDLKKADFQKFSAYGHCGRSDLEEIKWEKAKVLK